MSQIRMYYVLFLCAVLLLCFVLTVPAPAKADRPTQSPQTMPGVIKEMADPAFWSGLADDPDALLATPEEIAQTRTAKSWSRKISTGSPRTSSIRTQRKKCPCAGESPLTVPI